MNIENRLSIMSAFIAAAFLLGVALVFVASAHAAPYRIGVLMLGDVRLDPLKGLKEGLGEMGLKEGKQVVFEIQDVQGERARLLEAARKIVSRKPDVAIACGGVEADALKTATEGTAVPVVFLAVASAIDRGLIATMARPGGNLTGIDTNDTELTAKRLWLLKKMAPEIRSVLVPNIPEIKASAKTVEMARARGAELGLDIRVLEAEDAEGMRKAVAAYDFSTVDAVYSGMAAPVWQIEKEVFLPVTLKNKIPIFGVNRANIERGAVASYACSRFETGKQAARLVKKVLEGESPANTPAETPDSVEFVINRWMAERLGLDIPIRVWKLANEVVQTEVLP